MVDNISRIECVLEDPEGRSIHEVLKFCASFIHTELEELEQTVFDYGCLFADFRNILTLHHLGAVPHLDMRFLQGAIKDKVLECFDSSWLDANPEEKPLMTKCRDSDAFSGAWYTVFRDAAWLSFVTNDEECIRFLAHWVESWFKVGLSGAYDADETLEAQFLIMILAHFRSETLIGLGSLENEIRKSRKKLPKLLLDAWHAVLDQNNERFRLLLTDCVELFVSRQDKSQLLHSIVPVPHAILFNAGRKLLGTHIQLPDSVAPYICIPESVGILEANP